MKYELYEHHGKKLWVRSDLKGKHREHCLCFSCEKLDTVKPDKNCEIANALYRFDILANVTTPVWECKKFVLIS